MIAMEDNINRKGAAHCRLAGEHDWLKHKSNMLMCSRCRLIYYKNRITSVHDLMALYFPHVIKKK